jgi:hypothetical protein
MVNIKSSMKPWQPWVIVWIIAAQGAYAAPIVDDESGKWFDNFSDDLGISVTLSSDIQHDPILGRFRVATSKSSGVLVTRPIHPEAFSSWIEIVTDADLDPASDGFLAMDVLDVSGNPIANHQGLNAANPVNLATLPAASVGEVQLRFTLRGTDTLSSIKLKWEPKPILSVTLDAPSQSYRFLDYTITCGVSLVEVTQLQCQLTLTPPVPAYAGQQTSALFVSAESNGTFSPSLASISWDLGSVPPGEPIVLRARLMLPPEIRHQQVFTAQASLTATGADLRQSFTRTTSAQIFPNALLSLNAGENVLQTAAGDVVLSGPAPEFGVFVSLPESDFDLPGKLRQPIVYESLTNWLSVFTPSAGTLTISDGGRYEPAFVPPVGGSPRPAIVWNLPPLLPGQSWAGSYRPSLPIGAFEPSNTKLRQAEMFASELGYAVPANRNVRLGSTDIVAGEFAVGDFGVTPDPDGFEESVMVGDPLTYYLQMTNRNLVELQEVVVLAPVPANSQLLDWTLATSSPGQRFYSTTADPTFHPNNPPPIEVAAGGNDINPPATSRWINWDDTPPVDLATVTWVAALVPRLGAVFAPGALPSAAEAMMLVEPLTSAVPTCTAAGSLTAQGRTVVFRKAPMAGGPSVPAVGSGSFVQVNSESTTIRPRVPSLSFANLQRDITGFDPNTGLVEVRLSGRVHVTKLPATGASVTVSWDLGSSPNHSPPVTIASVQPAEGAQLDSSETAVTLALGNVAMDQSRDFAVNLLIPSYLAAQGYPRVQAVASSAEMTCLPHPPVALFPSTNGDGPRFLVSHIESQPFVSEGGGFTQTVRFANAGTQASTATLGVVRLSQRALLQRVDASPNLRLRGLLVMPPIQWFEFTPWELDSYLVEPDWVVDSSATHGGYWTLPASAQWLVLLLDHPDSGQWLPGLEAGLSWTLTHLPLIPLEGSQDSVVVRTEAFLVGTSVIDPDQRFFARSGSSSTRVYQDPDSDNDGLPDALEMVWFGSLAQNGSNDSDGDGFTNLTEWLLGSAPNSPASRPKISVDLSDPLWIRFQSPPVQDPRLLWQFSHTLSPDSWHPAPERRWGNQPIQIPRLGATRSFLRVIEP